MKREIQNFELYLLGLGVTEWTVQKTLGNLQRLLNFSYPLHVDDVRAYIRQLFKEKKSKATVNKYIDAAKHWGRFLQSEEFEVLSRFKEEPQEYDQLSEQEARQLINLRPKKNVYKLQYVLPHWNKLRMIYLCLLHSGARITEIRILQKSNVDLSRRCFVFPKSKTGKGRTVIINDELYPEIEKHLSTLQGELLFPTRGDLNKPVSLASIEKDWKMRLQALGITKNVRAYDFRGEYITRNLDAGVPLIVVQEHVGHKDPKTTKRYYKSTVETLHQHFKRDPYTQKTLTNVDLVKQGEEKLNALRFEDHPGIDTVKYKQAVALLWDSIKQ